MALDVPTTERALAAVRRAGVPLQIGFQRRYDPGYQEARRRIAAGEVGRLHLFRAVSHDPYPPPEGYIAGCGGQFVDMTIHDLDLARFLTADEVERSRRWGRCWGPRGRPSARAGTGTPPCSTCASPGAPWARSSTPARPATATTSTRRCWGAGGRSRWATSATPRSPATARTGPTTTTCPTSRERFAEAYARRDRGVRGGGAGREAGQPHRPRRAHGAPDRARRHRVGAPRRLLDAGPVARSVGRPRDAGQRPPSRRSSGRLDEAQVVDRIPASMATVAGPVRGRAHHSRSAGPETLSLSRRAARSEPAIPETFRFGGFENRHAAPCGRVEGRTSMSPRPEGRQIRFRPAGRVS